MPRLRILNGGAEIELLPGVNRIGRTAENDIQLDEPSVSNTHCQILIDERGATLRDLGSSSGTFAGYQRVTEALLRHGQGVRVGSVQMIFEDVSPIKIVSPPAPPPAPEIDPATSSTCCPYHPTLIGKFICKGCHQWFCHTCVNERRVANKDMIFCRRCGEECIATEVFFAEPPARPNFFREVPAAFAYPFRGDGLMIFMGGTLIYLVFHALGVAAAYAMFGGILILGLRILVAGYIVASVLALIEYSAQGDNRPFIWPEFSEILGDILYPLLLFTGTSVICFAPAGIALFALPEAATPLFILGAFYLPMGMLAVALFDTLSGLNPLLILLSIVKVPLQYLVACVVLLLALGTEIGIRWLLESLVTTPFLLILLGSPIAFYFIVVETRILGLLYNTNKARLDWFGESTRPARAN